MLLNAYYDKGSIPVCVEPTCPAFRHVPSTVQKNSLYRSGEVSNYVIVGLSVNAAPPLPPNLLKVLKKGMNVTILNLLLTTFF